MRIVVAHNNYRWTGGEEEVFKAESELLESRGHEVIRFVKDNKDLDDGDRLGLARRTIWNRESYDELRELFRSREVEVAHFHNTLPQISPAAYYAARAEGVAVVQTLHNFRLACINGNLFREGRVCEDCVGKSVSWPGIRHACYRGSTGASAVVASMLAFHRLRGTYRRVVDTYIALSEASRAKLIEIGLPPDKLVVKPNFVLPEPEAGAGDGDYAIYVGRVSAEKGVNVLLEAWDMLTAPYPLKIVGEGPRMEFAHAAAERNASVQILGRRPRDEVFRLMGSAQFLILPSIVYENFPMTVAEAFASGLPALVSGHGAMGEIVDDGVTGLHFRPGDPADLAAKVDWLAQNPDSLPPMRVAARNKYVESYSAERSYEQLMRIYEGALVAVPARAQEAAAP